MGHPLYMTSLRKFGTISITQSKSKQKHLAEKWMAERNSLLNAAINIQQCSGVALPLTLSFWGKLRQEKSITSTLVGQAYSISAREILRWWSSLLARLGSWSYVLGTISFLADYYTSDQTIGIRQPCASAAPSNGFMGNPEAKAVLRAVAQCGKSGL